MSARSADFPFLLLQKKELTLMGSRAASRADFLEALDLVRRRKVDLSRLISRAVPVERAAEAFRDLDEHAGSLVKMELEFE